MHDPPDLVLAQLAARTHGVVTRRDALALGLTRHHLEGFLGRGMLIRLDAGLYRHAASPETTAGRLLAAVRSCGEGAVASHRSAAQLWEMRGVPRWRPEVTLAGRRLPRSRRALVHRTDTLAPTDVAVRDGVPITSVARTLLDLGAVVERGSVELAAQDAVIRGLVDEAALVCILERLGGRGRRGTAALRTAVRTQVPPGEIESRLELALLRLVRACPVPTPVLQFETAIEGRRMRFDLAWPDRRLAVEADGRRWHATRQDFERDLVRRRAIAAAGWRHHPFGWTDVHQRPDVVRREITALFEARSAA